MAELFERHGIARENRVALLVLDQQRLDFIAQLLTDIGRPDPALAQVIYATYIGLDDLSAKHELDMSPGIQRLIEMILDGAPAP